MRVLARPILGGIARGLDDLGTLALATSTSQRAVTGFDHVEVPGGRGVRAEAPDLVIGDGAGGESSSAGHGEIVH